MYFILKLIRMYSICNLLNTLRCSIHFILSEEHILGSIVYICRFFYPIDAIMTLAHLCLTLNYGHIVVTMTLHSIVLTATLDHIRDMTLETIVSSYTIVESVIRLPLSPC
jgi:hypothetical protein